MSDSLPLRIKVLLHKIYDDHRQKAIVTIDKSWTIVKHLQTHIQSMFHIKKVYVTTLDGFWFPSNESISVLMESETVVAHSLGGTSSELNCSKNSVKSSIFTTNVNDLPTNDTTVSEPVANKKRKRKIEHCNDAPEIVIDDPVAEVVEKKKRKRVRKRKQKNVEIPVESPPGKHSKWISDLNRLDITDTVKTNSKRDSKKFKNPMPEIVPKAIKSKTHIRFSGNENSDNDNEKPYECDNQTTEDNVQDEDDEPFVLPTQARIVSATYTETDLNATDIRDESAATRKTDEQPLSGDSTFSIPIIKDKSLPPSKPNTEPKSELVTKQTDVVPKETTMEIMAKNIDILAFPALVGSPNINDVIAFKTLKLTETYEPTMSEYIIGIVQKVDEEKLTMFIVAGDDQLKDPAGKFQLSDDEKSDVTDDSKTEVEMRQSELLEPKICQLTADK